MPGVGEGPRLDQRLKRRQVWDLALARAVLRPVDAAVGAATQQVQGSVAVPVDDERVAVLERLAADHEHLRRRRELPLSLSLEPVEGASEVPHDQVQLPIAIPIDGERSRANLLGQPVIAFGGNDERLAVRALQDFRLAKGPVLIAAEHLEQPRHVLVIARVGAGENVEMAITEKVHKLWSGRGASPHTRNFGVLAFRLKPDAFGEFPFAKVLVDLDFAFVELSDIKIFLVVQTRRGEAGRLNANRHPARFQEWEGGQDLDRKDGLNANRHPARFQAHRGLEFRGATPGSTT